MYLVSFYIPAEPVLWSHLQHNPAGQFLQPHLESISPTNFMDNSSEKLERFPKSETAKLLRTTIKKRCLVTRMMMTVCLHLRVESLFPLFDHLLASESLNLSLLLDLSLLLLLLLLPHLLLLPVFLLPFTVSRTRTVVRMTLARIIRTGQKAQTDSV